MFRTVLFIFTCLLLIAPPSLAILSKAKTRTDPETYRPHDSDLEEQGKAIQKEMIEALPSTPDVETFISYIRGRFAANHPVAVLYAAFLLKNKIHPLLKAPDQLRAWLELPVEMFGTNPIPRQRTDEAAAMESAFYFFYRVYVIYGIAEFGPTPYLRSISNFAIPNNSSLEEAQNNFAAIARIAEPFRREAGFPPRGKKRKKKFLKTCAPVFTGVKF